MKLSMPDESSQARGTMGYSSYATMAQGFGPGFDAPLIVAAALPSPTASTTRLAHAIAATPGIARVDPVRVSSDGQAALMIAYPTTGEQDSATNALVNRIRSSVIPQRHGGHRHPCLPDRAERRATCPSPTSWGSACPG